MTVSAPAARAASRPPAATVRSASAPSAVAGNETSSTTRSPPDASTAPVSSADSFRLSASDVLAYTSFVRFVQRSSSAAVSRVFHSPPACSTRAAAAQSVSFEGSSTSSAYWRNRVAEASIVLSSSQLNMLLAASDAVLEPSEISHSSAADPACGTGSPPAAATSTTRRSSASSLSSPSARQSAASLRADNPCHLAYSRSSCHVRMPTALARSRQSALPPAASILRTHSMGWIPASAFSRESDPVTPLTSVFTPATAFTPNEPFLPEPDRSSSRSRPFSMRIRASNSEFKLADTSAAASLSSLSPVVPRRMSSAISRTQW